MIQVKKNKKLIGRDVKRRNIRDRKINREINIGLGKEGRNLDDSIL